MATRIHPRERGDRCVVAMLAGAWFAAALIAPASAQIPRPVGVYVVNEASNEQSTATAYVSGLTASTAYRNDVTGHAIFVPIAKILPSITTWGQFNWDWISPRLCYCRSRSRTASNFRLNSKRDFRVRAATRSRCPLDLRRRAAPIARRCSTCGRRAAAGADASARTCCCRGFRRCSSSGRPLQARSRRTCIKREATAL